MRSLLSLKSPASQIGLFFYAATPASLPFGEGVRCVGQPFFRLYPGAVPDSGGTARHAIDFSSSPAGVGAGAFVAGTTYFFQFWYRDPLGGPAGYNLSSGLAITFQP